jgi:molybdopterin converting factor small subunit
MKAVLEMLKLTRLLHGELISTMRVKIAYLGLIRSKVGKREEQYEVTNDSSLSHLLKNLAETYGKNLDDLFSAKEESKLDPTFIVTVNGVLKDVLRGDDVKLKDGDSVALMTLISGG